MAKTRRNKASGFGKSVDFMIAIVLSVAALVLVLWHLGAVSIV
jgi:hypothetical protein